tara:strand:- start:453770 stop:454474 length:705 start_codon:yes stop_codon:yes gene_type:complete
MMDKTVTPPAEGTDTVNKVSGFHPADLQSNKSFRPKYSRNQKKAFKYLMTALTLGILLVISLIGWMMTGYKLSTVKSQYLSYQISTRQTINESQLLAEQVTELDNTVSTLRSDVAALVEQRIPNLTPLDFDVTVRTEQDYLKNISFTQTGTRTQKRYEYRAVLRNDNENDVRPSINILLFDGLGIQVGKATLSREHATSDADKVSLKPGEVRAYSSRVDLDRDATPEYFLVEVR